MQVEYSISISFNDACHQIGVESEQAYAIVECGIIAPQGDSPEDWIFDLDMISRAKRALRLQRDLHMDWSAVALLVSLLDERDQLRADNYQLRSQLQRFIPD
ncbi:MAG: chaperone modulator CbpM [Gammaproteobacteria bacterium]